MSNNTKLPGPSHDNSCDIEHPAPVTPRAREGYVPPATRRSELILGPTGPFRPLIERYMAEVAPHQYIATDVVKVRGDIAKFLRFVVEDMKITDLDLIRPSTVTRYVEKLRDEGYTTFLYLGHLATFFVWLISLGLYDHGNPVIARLHRALMKTPRHSPASSIWMQGGQPIGNGISS